MIILSAFTDFLNMNKPMIQLILILILLVALGILIVVAKLKREKENIDRSNQIKRMVTISVFAGLSSVLYFLKFPMTLIIPFLPSFLEVNFSMVPILIGGFMYGPISGAIMVVIRGIIKVPFTSTIGVGEFADVLLGLSVVLVASIIYFRSKTKRNGIVALMAGSLTWIAASLFFNWLFLLDFFIELYGLSGVLGLLQPLAMLFPGLDATNYMFPYLLYGILPFNLILSTVVSIITFLVYKKISKLLHKFDILDDDLDDSFETKPSK